jgi:hypothetical protein
MLMPNKFIDDLEMAQNTITDVCNQLLILDALKYSRIVFHIRCGQKYIGEAQKALALEEDAALVGED